MSLANGRAGACSGVTLQHSPWRAGVLIRDETPTHRPPRPAKRFVTGHGGAAPRLTPCRRGAARGRAWPGSSGVRGSRGMYDLDIPLRAAAIHLVNPSRRSGAMNYPAKTGPRKPRPAPRLPVPPAPGRRAGRPSNTNTPQQLFFLNKATPEHHLQCMETKPVLVNPWLGRHPSPRPCYYLICLNHSLPPRRGEPSPARPAPPGPAQPPTAPTSVGEFCH